MLQPYLKIWEWKWIFGRAVKAISSSGVRSPCIYLKLSNKILQVVGEFIICWEVTIDKVVHTVACGAVICASRAQ